MDNERRKNVEGGIFLVLFCLTIPAANWMIGHVGTVCVPNGPVPGAGRAWHHGALRCADGRRRAGAARSGAAPARRRVRHRRDRCRRGDFAGLAPPSLVMASAVAFLLSEFADFAVYTPLARRRLVAAVVASSVVGLVVDFDRISVARLRFARVPARPDDRQALDGAAGNSLGRLSAPPRRTARTGGRVRPAMSFVRRDPAKRHHRHHHHDAAEEGHSPLLDGGRNAVRLFRQARGRSGLHAALRSGARGSGDAGELVEADIYARRHRGHAGELRGRRRCHGRDRRRHLRRHSVHAHGQARRHRAHHRRRDARQARRAGHRPAGLVRGRGGAGLGQPADLRRLERADRLRRLRDFSGRHHRCR